MASEVALYPSDRLARSEALYSKSSAGLVERQSADLVCQVDCDRTRRFTSTARRDDFHLRLSRTRHRRYHIRQ